MYIHVNSASGQIRAVEMPILKRCMGIC